KIQKDAGLKFNVLDREDRRQESPLFADDIRGGLECETDSLINPYLSFYSLVERTRKYGLTLQNHTQETYITNTKDYSIDTTAGKVTAKRVVNAAGIWAPFIGEMICIDIPIVPRKGHIIVGSRSEPVMMRNVMEFGYLMNKFERER